MTSDVTIGVCEDDDELRGVLRDALEREGYRAVVTAYGSEAIQVFSRTPPSVVIMDIGLPDADGRDVCQALRAQGFDRPVLFLTARDALTDRLSGFRAGGDDYLAKPFAIAELLARLEALVRRAPAPEQPSEADALGLDPAAHALVVGDVRVSLTPTEFRLLSHLSAHRGQVVRRVQLVGVAWPEGAVVHDNTLDAYVARLRRKLRQAGSEMTIETTRGVGYVLR